ncbi:MAG: biopolymer transporter ExbD [Acidovorax sp.]
MPFGRLERTPGPRPMSEINITPLVDVMLVLVVIFILTAPLLSSSLRLELPRAEGVQPGTPARAVTVAVGKDGQAFLNGEAVDQDALARRLKEIAARQPDTEVQLRADTAVPYGRVAEVMGAAQAAGLMRLAFVAEPLKK